MNSDQIKQLIKQEVSKAMLSQNGSSNPSIFQSGNPQVLQHNHDGGNSPKINGKNIISNNKYNGFVTITGGTAQANTRVINGITNPSSVSFYGIAYYASSYTFILTTTGYPLASVGDVYSQNGNNYTVTSVRAAGSNLMSFSGTILPSPSGALIKVSGSGDAGISYTNFTINNAGVTYKASITGNAQLGNVYQLTQQNSTVISTNITQSNVSTFFDGSVSLVDKNSNVFTYWQPTVDSDELYLASIYNTSGTLVGNIKVTAFTNTSITLQAPLNSGWIIQGAIMIT
jgi:hypothetical protein